MLSYEAISGNSTFQSETDIRVVLPESAFDRIVSAINGNDANRVSSSVEAFCRFISKGTTQAAAFGLPV